MPRQKILQKICGEFGNPAVADIVLRKNKLQQK